MDAIFCEDIRFEVNNKISLMGLYTDQIIFRFPETPESEIKWPVVTNLALLLRVRIEKNEKYPSRFKFAYFLNDKKIATIEGKINTNDNQYLLNLILLTPQISLQPGDLSFFIELLNEQDSLFTYKEECAIKINLGD